MPFFTGLKEERGSLFEGDCFIFHAYILLREGSFKMDQVVLQIRWRDQSKCV